MSEHRIEIQSDFLDDGWTGCCSCGWQGVEQESAAAAVSDAQSHLRFATSREKGSDDRGR